MKKLLYIIICSLIVGNCNIKSIEQYHGVTNLESKQTKLLINKSNKNDIIDILGPPSTESLITNNLWIYIENKKTKSSLFKLGKSKVATNNVLILEIDKYGILKNKKIYNKDDQNKILFTKNKTAMSEKDTFVYGVFSSLRQKIDSPKRNRSKN
tara:strand:+ start:257 stop:718 length:462 start_codon:yes stop_codon:yes gene_type:complete